MKRHASPDPAHPMTCRSQKKMRSTDNTDDSNNNTINNKRGKSIHSDQPNTSGQNNGSGTTTYDATVEKIKQQARELYNEKEYDSALGTYTLLIGLCPNDAIFYGNRAACHMMLGDYIKALKDAKNSVELEPTFIKGHCRVIKCATILDRGPDMESSIAKLKEIDPNNEIVQYHVEKMRELSMHHQNEVNANAVNDYVKALEHIEKYLKICSQSLVYKVKKAECFVNLRRFSEAETLARDILKENPNNNDIHYVLGRCLHETDIEASVHHFEEAFRLSPHSGKDRHFHEAGKAFLVKKMEANNAYKSQHFSQAYDLYSKLLLECMKNTGMFITLFFNMAQASYKLGNLDRCLQECTKVLHLKPNHLKALMRRAKCHMDQKHYEKAIQDLEKALGVESSAEVLKMFQEARKLLEASKNDFYAILGVVHGATTEMITKAYKELTKVHHPDRHVNATAKEKKYHEIKCKEITRAYRLLMDQKPACETHNNNTNGSQGTNSARKQPPRGFNSDCNNNNGQKSSSSSGNNNSTGPQSSAGRSNTCNGQKFPSGNTNNNFSGSQSSSSSVHFKNCNGQQFSSVGGNNNFTGPQSSAGEAKTHNGQQFSSEGTHYNFTRPQSSAGESNTYNGQQFSSVSTNNNFTGAESSPGGVNNCNGQHFSSGTFDNRANGQQPSPGAYNYNLNGQQFYTFIPNGYQYSSEIPTNNLYGQQYSSGVPHVNPYAQQNTSRVQNGNLYGQQYATAPSHHYNQKQPSSGIFSNTCNASQSSPGFSYHCSQQQPSSGTSDNNWNGPQSSSATYNNNNNNGQQCPPENWSEDDDNDDRNDEEDDWNKDDCASDFEEYVYKKSRPRRQWNRHRSYWKRKYQRYCHNCDWYIYGANKCCPHCGFYP